MGVNIKIWSAEIIRGIRTIFTDQLPTYLVFRKVHSILASEFF
jgi:hypothetical protein